MTSSFLHMQLLMNAPFLMYFPNFVNFRVKFVVHSNQSFSFLANTPLEVQSHIASQVEMPNVYIYNKNG